MWADAHAGLLVLALGGSWRCACRGVAVQGPVTDDPWHLDRPYYAVFTDLTLEQGASIERPLPVYDQFETPQDALAAFDQYLPHAGCTSLPQGQEV